MKIQINDFLSLQKGEYGVIIQDSFNKVYFIYEESSKLINAIKKITAEKKKEQNEQEAE